VVTIGRHAITPGALEAPTCHIGDLETGAWSRLTTATFDSGRMQTENSVVYHTTRDRYYNVEKQFHSFNSMQYLRGSDLTVQTTADYSFPSEPSGSGGAYHVAMLDPDRDMIVMQHKNAAFMGFDCAAETSGWRTLAHSGTFPVTNERWARVANKDAYYKLPSTGGSTLYKLTPPASSPFSNTWAVTSIALSQSVSAFGDVPAENSCLAYGSLVYCPARNRLYWFSHGTRANGAINQVAEVVP
jgi:hypothetical protein